MVNSVNLNANDALTAENPLNGAPADGQVYILVNISVTYTGDDADGKHPMPVIEFVGKDGKSYNGLDKLLVAPEAFSMTSALYKDATATGNIALQVPADGLDQGVLAVKASPLGEKHYVAVQ